MILSKSQQYQINTTTIQNEENGVECQVNIVIPVVLNVKNVTLFER